MNFWSQPQMRLLRMTLQENIAASDSSDSRQVGEFWYTGQGNGNREWGRFYYTWQGNKKMVQDTYKAGGDDNLTGKDLEGAILNCMA